MAVCSRFGGNSLLDDFTLLLVAKMKKYILSLVLLLVYGSHTFAQCPMCRSAVQSSMKSGGKSVGMGLNDGIILLIIIVYSIIFLGVSIWYIKSRKAQRNVAR